MSRTSVDSVESLATGRATLPRVNLLPPEVHQARQLRRLQAGLGVGVAAVALAVGGFYFLQTQAAGDAQESLNQVAAKGSTLTAQKAQYAQVPRTLSAIEAAESARQNAMANDVQWYRYLNDLSYVTPKNAWFLTVDISLNQSGVVNVNPVAHASIATVTVTGAAKVHNDVASWLNSASKESGWTDAYFTNSQKQDMNGETFVQFSSTANVTDDALSHRYDRKAG
ncbi:MAG: PilN domain-containing protein [Actinomycetales bacterium]